MNNESAQQLLEKYYLGKLSTEELVALEAWFETLPEEKMVFAGGEKEKFIRKMKVEIDNATGHTVTIERKLWPLMVAVAAAIATIVVGVWLYTANHAVLNENAEVASQLDIVAGKNGATLKLSNGETIALSNAQDEILIGDNKIRYADGSEVLSDQEALGASAVTASTAKGQTYAFILPDGTKVWLNADSKISFLQQFVRNTREVLLDGEAYFEVAKNKNVPFIVKSPGQEVEVLGTHFNVKRYADGTAGKTTLLEGSVVIKSASLKRELKPGEQAVNDGYTLAVGKVDTEDVIAWKNGYFRFNEARLGQIVSELERWYDVEIVLEDHLADIQFTGKISRNKHMNHLLHIIQRTININYKIEGRRITIMNK